MLFVISPLRRNHMIDKFLALWIWYSVAVLFICFAIYRWNKAVNDRDKYLAEANRLYKSLGTYCVWIQKYDTAVAEKEYLRAFNCLGDTEIEASLRENMSVRLPRFGQKIEFDTASEWKKAFEVCLHIPSRNSPSKLLKILKQNFAWWLVREATHAPQAAFTWIVEQLEKLEEHSVNSDEWHGAMKTMILMAADRATTVEELDSLHKFVINNRYRAEIYPALRVSASRIPENSKKSGGVIISC